MLNQTQEKQKNLETYYILCILNSILIITGAIKIING